LIGRQAQYYANEGCKTCASLAGLLASFTVVVMGLAPSLGVNWYFVGAGDAWVEVHHNMPTISDSIKSQLEAALVIGTEPLSPTCAVVDVFD